MWMRKSLMRTGADVRNITHCKSVAPKRTVIRKESQAPKLKFLAAALLSQWKLYERGRCSTEELI